MAPIINIFPFFFIFFLDLLINVDLSLTISVVIRQFLNGKSDNFLFIAFDAKPLSHPFHTDSNYINNAK